MAQITLKSQQKMGKEKILETKDREYIYKLLSFILEASSDTTGAIFSGIKPILPRIGLIPMNIAPIEKPDKEEATENMKAPFNI